MANKRSRDLLKKLKKLKRQDREQVVQRPRMGELILSLLTPTQYAELFPDYFRRGLPDVSGFREAITRKTQAEQQKYYDEIDQKLGSMSPGGAVATSGRGNVKGPFSAAQYAATLRQAGFQEKDIAIMTAVGMRESNGKVNAANDQTSREKSYGLWQINIQAHPFNSPEMQYAGINSIADLNDPVKNAKVAYYLYYKTDRGIRHWGGYTDGGYRQYMATAEAAASGRFAPTASGAGGSAPNFGQYALAKGVDNYTHECGKGARMMAGHMFGHQAFLSTGLGGDGTAGSLSKGNSYFQNSGLFKTGRGIGKDHLTQEYLASLPIGTVISSTGGNRGQGHAQIKIGPNQWASDTVQSNFLMNGYDNFVIHEPNEAGLARLSANGVVQPTIGATGGPETPQVTAQVTPQQTVSAPPPGPTYAPDIPEQTPDVKQESPTVPVEERKQKGAAKAETATATVNKAQPAGPRTFNVNKEALISAIRQTPDFQREAGMFAGAVPDETIWSGFFSDSRTKDLFAKTGTSFDPNTGQAKIANYEKFQKMLGMDTGKILSEVPANTPAHAAGGKERVHGAIQVTHLHRHHRGDTALVTDSRGKRFTVNPEKERLSVNPKKGIMTITPYAKEEQMDIDKLMALLRRQESGKFEGDYSSDLKKKGSKNTASGAYQYNDKTWKAVAKQYGIGTEYKRAVDAPKHVQDQLTKTRLEDLRKKGYSDHQIMMTHFTGNKRGILGKGAAAGNPTPAQYSAQMAAHSKEYDTNFRSQVASVKQPEPKLETNLSFGPETTASAAETSAPKVAASPQERPFLQRAQAALSEFGIGEKKAEAQPLPKSTYVPPAPNTTAAEVGALRQDMQSGFDNVNKAAKKGPPEEKPDTAHQNMMSSFGVLNKAPINPAQQRFQDNLQQWSGDHFSLGNKN